jgi:hypothetical protein
MKTREYYRVDFKENEYGLWICGDEYDDYEYAKNTYDYKKQNFKGVQLVKFTEEILEEHVSENPFLLGDYVEIIRECAIKGRIGQISRFSESNNEVIVRIDDNTEFTGTFEDIQKFKK